MLEYLRDRLHVPIGRLRQSIEARMPDEEVASLLEIDLTQPVLLIQLKVLDKSGMPVEIADMFYRADRYRFEMHTPQLPNRRASTRSESRVARRQHLRARQ
jgi:GntR family transcriptional regulator